MNFSDYLLYKAVALVAIVMVGNFVYAFVTGKTIEEARRDKAQGQKRPEER